MTIRRREGGRLFKHQTTDLDNVAVTGCSLNIVFFPRILGSLPPLPRQLSTAIGCTKKITVKKAMELESESVIEMLF